MPKSPQEIIATWPKWKRELAGFKATCKAASKEVSTWPKWKQDALGILHVKEENMKKSLTENIVEQFKAVMREKHIDQSRIAEIMGVTRANVSAMFTKQRGLSLKSIERLAEAIGGEIDIKFIPMKSELELLREENERLKKMLGAKRYVENGTLNKK